MLLVIPVLGEAASSRIVIFKSQKKVKRKKKKKKNGKLWKLKQLVGLFAINKSHLLCDSVSRKALKNREQCVLLLSGIFLHYKHKTVNCRKNIFRA